MTQQQPRRFTTNPSQAEPIPFIIDGHVTDARGRPTGERFEEEFVAVAVAPGGAIDDLSRMMRVDRQGNEVYDGVSIQAFFASVLVDEDVPRFIELLHDKTRIVDIQTVGDIAMWLQEKYTDRPTSRS